MFLQVATLLGSLLVLGAYALNQTGRVTFNSWWYIGLNLAGSVFLGSVSFYIGLWGYVLLNVVWCIIGLHAMYRRLL